MQKLLRKIFFLRKLYGRKTATAIMLDYGISLALLFLVIMSLYAITPYVLLLVLLWLYAFLRSVTKSLIIVGRKTNSAATTFVQPGLPSMIQLAAINDDKNNIDRTKTIAATGDWRVYETEIDVFRSTKNGEYLSKQLYYTVFEGRLSRELPNILLDSSRAKGRQFRYDYVGSQRLSFEGNFDSSFTVYAPDYYEIDTLSFITPEVMEALQRAHDYDIEIVGDRLFMYGPLLFEDSDVATMEAHGQELIRALNDNIDTYADSYVLGKNKRSSTTQFARQLLQSPVKSLLATAAVTITAIGIVVAAVIKQDGDIIANQFSFYIYVLLVASAARSYRIIVRNRRARSQFLQDQKFIAYTRSTHPGL